MRPMLLSIFLGCQSRGPSRRTQWGRRKDSSLTIFIPKMTLRSGECYVQHGDVAGNFIFQGPNAFEMRRPVTRFWPRCVQSDLQPAPAARTGLSYLIFKICRRVSRKQASLLWGNSRSDQVDVFTRRAVTEILQQVLISDKARTGFRKYSQKE